jgi:mono/diheme cytochrome c family protein
MALWKRLGVAGFALVLAAPLFAQTSAAVSSAQTSAAVSSAVPSGTPLGQPLAQRSPTKTYASVCAYCHGHNVGPIILGRHLAGDTIRTMVREGRNGMPAFRPSEISPAELDALAVWISKAPGNPMEHGE